MIDYPFTTPYTMSKGFDPSSESILWTTCGMTLTYGVEQGECWYPSWIAPQANVRTRSNKVTYIAKDKFGMPSFEDATDRLHSS